MKAHLRQQGLFFYQENALYSDSELYDACSCITAEMTWGYFQHWGYYFG